MDRATPTSRLAAVLLYDWVEVLDFAGPFEVFSVASELVGANRLRVATVSERGGPVRAIGGLTVRPTHAFENGPAPDILVVPGGDGSRREMDNPALIEWVTGAYGNAEIVLSDCSGARIRAKAELLDGLSVTTHHLVTEQLRELAPEAVVEPGPRFIDTGRIVTTGGISAGIDGAFHVVARLFGEDTAREVATYMEYDWRGDRSSGPSPGARRSGGRDDA